MSQPSKTVDFTGASSGFGEGAAKALADRGYRVGTLRDADGRGHEKGAALEAYATNPSVIDMDLASDASVAAGFAAILREGRDGFGLLAQAQARLRAAIYDAAVLRLTEGWYRAVLGRLPRGARVLDVGIGTAGALARNASVVAEHGLRVTGIDVDLDYVEAAREAVRRAALVNHVDVRHEPLEDHAGGPYDAVYFSGSFMLMPEPDLALRRAQGLLSPSGRAYFTQTLQRYRSRLVEWIKPRLAQVTTIDFGRVSYEDEFFERLDGDGWEVVEDVRLRSGLGWSHRLVVAKPGP